MYLTTSGYQTDVDWVKFTPTVTGTYKVAVTGSSAPSRLDVYVPDEYDVPLVPWGNSTCVNPFTENYMQAGQTYYIKVSAPYAHLNVESYKLTVTKTASYAAEADAYEGDNSRSAAKTLTLGTPQAHSIHTVGDRTG